MEKQSIPLYGSFDFGLDLSIDLLIERLSQISGFFLHDHEFNSYLKTAKGENHYGLSSEELKALFSLHEGNIAGITSSSSTEDGIGVNINIRFQPGSTQGSGQFVIVATERSENEEIRDMLLGIWIPRPKEAPVTEIEPLISKDPPEEAGEDEAQPDEEEPVEDEISPEKEEVAVQAENNISPLGFLPKVPNIPVQQKVHSRFEKREQKFHFNKNTPVDTLVNLVYDLFIKYLDSGTFDIRVLTFEGDFLIGIKIEALNDKLNELWGEINKLYIDMVDIDGDRISLTLSYNPLSLNPESEVLLYVEKPDPVIKLIMSSLSQSQATKEGPVGMKYEAFSFDPRHFFIEEAIFTVNKIAKDYLKNGHTMAFLSNIQGDHFHDISLTELKELYFIYQSAVNVLTLYLSRPVTGQSINLVFDFQNSCGSFAILMGDEKSNSKIKEIIWNSLYLSPYKDGPKPSPQTLGTMEDGPTHAQPKVEKPAGSASSAMSVTPLFQGRDFNRKEGGCLVLLSQSSPEAEQIWREFKRAIHSTGRQSFRGDALFGYKVLESLWHSLNEYEVIIADISRRPAEVFYLIGIAHTLGKEVLLTAQHPGDIPFDFKKHRHIIYESNEEGLRRLRQDLFAHLQEL